MGSRVSGPKKVRILSDLPRLILDGLTQQPGHEEGACYHTSHWYSDGRLLTAGSYNRLACILCIEGVHVAVALLAASCRQQGGVYMQGLHAM